MYRIEVHERINQMSELFYRVGMWHRGDEATIKETRVKIFYSIFYLLFPTFIIIGAIRSDHRSESIFLIQIGISTLLMEVKLLYIFWRKKEILELLNRISVYTLNDQKDFNLVNYKLKFFMNCATIFLGFAFSVAAITVFIIPFVGNERNFFFNIWFPLDYKNNETAFWIAYALNFFEMFLSASATFLSVIIWYLLLNCSLKFEVLDNEIRNMGTERAVIDEVNTPTNSETENSNLFNEQFITSVKSHEDTKEATEQLESFVLKLLSAQTATGAVSICGSTYCLAFNESENLFELLAYGAVLIYNLFDIFMVMYYGNEIKLSTESLMYCLFESNWTIHLIIIFAELLKQPYELIILKLYPLTLETFIRILNSAYTMFNILKSLA